VTKTPSLLKQLLFPEFIFYRGGVLSVTGEGKIAGRQAVILSWTDGSRPTVDRIWIDAMEGVILRYVHVPPAYADASGKTIPSEIVVNSIQFDIDIPGETFNLNASTADWIEPDSVTP
jgi:hypothetical protein